MIAKMELREKSSGIVKSFVPALAKKLIAKGTWEQVEITTKKEEIKVVEKVKVTDNKVKVKKVTKKKDK